MPTVSKTFHVCWNLCIFHKFQHTWNVSLNLWRTLHPTFWWHNLKHILFIFLFPSQTVTLWKKKKDDLHMSFNRNLGFNNRWILRNVFCSTIPIKAMVCLYIKVLTYKSISVLTEILLNCFIVHQASFSNTFLFMQYICYFYKLSNFTLLNHFLHFISSNWYSLKN